MTSGLITIREAVPSDARAIADVHVNSWRETYPGIVSQAYLDALSLDERTADWKHRLCTNRALRPAVFVAVAYGEVVGFVAGGPRPAPANGYDAQLHAIYLNLAAQGRGTGRKLARTWAAAAVDRGLVGAVADVLAGNPARGFYERMGARHLEDIEVVIGDEPYTESRFGWPDLRALAV